ncbi:MAG: FAD-dependent oxidoreductase, partial [bacterium]
FQSSSTQQEFNLSKIKFDQNTYPALVLGAGVAGLTAANYIAQANIPCTVIEGEKPGGALAQSSSVRNWPGVIDASGASIIDSLRKQTEKNGVQFFSEKVIEANLKEWPYKFLLEHSHTKQKRWVKALSCIIAMGDTQKYLDIPGETGPDGYWGRGVGNCALCEGSLYKNKHIAIVGGGDAAIEEASYLAGIARGVTIFVRKDTFKAQDKKKKEEVLSRPNIHVIFDTQLKQIHGDGKNVTHLTTINTKTNSVKKIAIDGVFLTIGSTPNSQIFQGQLDLNDDGTITRFSGQQTSVPGVYAAGDIADSAYKQAVTAAGAACRAAIQLTDFLDDIGFKEQKEPSKSSIQTTIQNIQTRQPEINHHKFIEEMTNIKEIETLMQTSPLPIVVDVYANLCISCQQMEPVLVKLAQEFSDKVHFIKVRIGIIEPTKLATLVKGGPITTVPTFLLIKSGKEVHRMQNLISEQDFRNKIIDFF